MGVINNGVLDGTRRVGPGVRELGVNGGIAGAPLGMRLRGASQSGGPLIGSWKAGDQITDRAGRIWVCTVSGTPGTWTQSGDSGVTVKVAPPTGATATDSPALAAALAKLTAALNIVPAATLMFADGVYQFDGNSLVVWSLSNFAIRSSGQTVIQQAPNRAGDVNNVTGDVAILADCNDVTVGPGITFDGNRDSVAPVVPLSATAASGQATVTVAAGAAAGYFAGQYLTLFGGIGSADQGKTDGFNAASTSPLVISSVTPGGGSGGGDLVTFTANLNNTYSVISATLLSDPYGPYGGAGAFLTSYQTGYNVTVAGRAALGSEDMQNGLHLMNCQRVKIIGCTARNVWESPFKIGCGVTTGDQATYANSCYDITVADCVAYHGYDQGVSVWVGGNVAVTGCLIDSPGWGGVVLTETDYCTVAGNEIRNIVYQGAGQAGGGIVVEGGIRNTIDANAITSPELTTAWSGISVQGYPTSGTWGLSTTNTNWPTLGAFLEQGTVPAGTSVLLSSSSRCMVGGRYSVFDGHRTESVTVATVPDGTHVTFAETLRYSHASGLYLTPRLSEDNLVTANVIDMSGALTGGDGIKLGGSVRNTIEANHVANWTNNGINLTAAAGWSPPGSYNAGDGSTICENRLGGGTNHGIAISQVAHLAVSGNQVFGNNGGTRGINIVGCVDSVFDGNQVSDSIGSAAIQISTGGPSTVVSARLTLANNVTLRANGAGIQAIGGDSLTFTGNVAKSNTGWGMQLQGVTNSKVIGGALNSNKLGGLTLANNSSTGCTGNTVIGVTARDDGTGVSPVDGSTFTQPHGIVESGNSNLNLFTLNEADANTTDQLITVGANSYAWANIESGAVVAGIAPPQGYYSPAGLTGATGAGRYVGATSTPGSGPASGTFLTGDWCTDPSVPAIWVCSAGGSPGTWGEIYAGTGLTNPMSAVGDTLYGGASGAATRLAGNTTATLKVLTQTGNGSASAAPVWQSLAGTANYGGLFGDGSDGPVTLDGTATVSWASKAGSVYTMTRDCFVTNLTVNSGVTLNAGPYRVFCLASGTVTNAGTIQANGASAASSSAPSGGTSGILQYGTAGGAGSTTNGSSSTAAGTQFGTGNSGGGGTGSGGTAGSGHNANASTASMHRNPALVLTGCGSWSGSAKSVSGASGGGGGGGDGTNAGGAAGSGAGIVAILAGAVVNTGSITAIGGNGFTPVTGNCGGGGGGLILIYTLTAWTAGTTSVAGGTQGSGAGTGAAGTAGSAGTVLNVILQ